MDKTTIPLAESRRLVVKVGSSLLVGEDGEIRRPWLNALCEDLANIAAGGAGVVVVSSGAVAAGRRHLGLKGSLRLDEKQAAAAAGQVRIAHAYQETLGWCHITVAQVLLTLDDSDNRRRYLNARNTLETLLNLGAIPVINENDTVATQEIRFGDNDRLAARVAQMIGADTLVLLSDIDGLYTADPHVDPNASIIPVIHELTPEIEAMAGDPVSGGMGSGGMVTKLQAARIALGAGCRMVIAPGVANHPLKALAEGGRCSWFLPSSEPLTARKQWIAGAILPQGELVVDAGACRALKAGGSLLPAGVVAVEGDFQKGESVIVRNREGREVARGLSGYSAADARLIMGHKSSQFETILGYRGKDEIIHRDDLVLELPAGPHSVNDSAGRAG